tara:strand:+ start:904 stop:1293 length:390 start_codon:yes stop_codon:yes gene_type:complete
MEIIINGYKMNITLINILEFIFIISACVVVFILFISVDTYIKFVFLYSGTVILIIILGINSRYNALMISNQEVILHYDEFISQYNNLRSDNKKIELQNHEVMISNQEVIFRCAEINLQLKKLRSNNIIV